MLKGEERFLSALEAALDGACADARDAVTEMAGKDGASDALSKRAEAEVSLAYLKTSVDAFFGSTAGVGREAAQRVVRALVRAHEADAAAGILISASVPDENGESTVLVFERGLPGLVRGVSRVAWGGDEAAIEAIRSARHLGVVAPFSQRVPSLRVSYDAARDALGEGDRRTLKRYESAVAAMAASVAAEMDLARRERSLSTRNPGEGVYHDWSTIQSAEAALRRAAASAYLDALAAMVAESGASEALVSAVRDMAMVNLGELQASDSKDNWSVQELRDAEGILVAVDVTMDDDSHVRYAVGGRPQGVEWTFWNYQRALSEISSSPSSVEGSLVPETEAGASGGDEAADA